MTSIVILPAKQMTTMLIDYYKMLDNCEFTSIEASAKNKKKVVVFVKEWCEIAKDAFYEDSSIKQLLTVISLAYKIQNRIRGILQIITPI